MNVASESAHQGDDPAHAMDSTTSYLSDLSPGTDIGGVHCQHTCHGHGAIIAQNLLPASEHIIASEPQIGETLSFLSYDKAPPVPPPIA